MQYELTGVNVIIVSLVVLWFGNLLTNKVAFLKNNNIPVPVTGGLICSGVIAILRASGIVEITFDMELRDTLLLVFFSTIGLGAHFRMLAAGGKALVILLVAATVFLVLQNTTGVGLAMLFGEHPGYGLLAGSVSFAGGHGTAIAWGTEAEKAGLADAQAVGIAFATFGLIAGGLLGGPISGWLIKRHGLQDGGTGSTQVTESAVETPATSAFDLTDVLGTILGLAICVGAGAVINRYLFSQGVLVPGFLTALIVGIILANLGDAVKVQVNKQALDMIGDVALYLFLTMSLMSMDLTSLSEAAGPIVSALFLQMLLITAFTVFVVFRIMGRDYDSAVICGGFVGLGLGATPVAIANMQATTKKFRPSPKAFLVVPLVGAFFIDITNALVIKFFIALPIFNQPPG